MKKTKSLYHRHRFPAAVISCAVRWYFRFSLIPEGAAFKPGAAQDRDGPVAQLPGGEG
jgi:hypothetical protein